MANSDGASRSLGSTGQHHSAPLLRVGSRILNDAYSGSDVLLLRAGVRIETIEELHRLAQSDVRFGEERCAEIPLDMENELALDAAEAASEEPADEFTVRIGRAVMLKSQAIEDIRSIFGSIEATGTVDLELAKQSVSTLLDDMLEDPMALVSLVKLKAADNYTFIHCVHVSILAMFLAMQAGYEDDIESIGMGALLHDIGKAGTPPQVLRKKGPLDSLEMRIVRQHPTIGARLLTDSGCSDKIALACVLDHHEKMTGSGYPTGKKGVDITPYAMITSLADIYDALTTDRPYRTAINPKDALLLMTQQMGNELHPRLLQRFVASIGYFPVGSTVRLTNGARAIVVSNNASDPLRPVVRVEGFLASAGGRPHLVDLSREKSLFIKQFLVERSAVDVAKKAV